MILLIVWDGLRPDMINQEDTPFLHQMAGEGVFCSASHAAFPTATRINSASLTTGCYPGVHGIVDNELYIPSIDPGKALSCANWKFLQTMADREGGALLDTLTIGEILQKSGLKMASAGSGSPGTTYLTNPVVTGPVVNWATAWPNEVFEEIKTRFGNFLDSETTSFERNNFIIGAVRDFLIRDYRPELLTLWITEPDHTQHEYGIASEEAKAALNEIDGQLEGLIGSIERSYPGEDPTCFLLSDHGFCTITERVNPEEELVSAGLKEPTDSNDIVRASNSFYLTGKAKERLAEIVRFLESRKWVGALFLRDDLLEECPDAMAQSTVFGGHRRSGEIMIGYQWSPEENRFGAPGCVSSSSKRMEGTHGSASPYAINNCLVAWGKRIKQGVVSTVPCAVVDVAPTALHLLGIKPPAEMDGRVLNEILIGGPNPGEFEVSHEKKEVTYQINGGERRQVAWYSKVEGYKYLDKVTLLP